MKWLLSPLSHCCFVVLFWEVLEEFVTTRTRYKYSMLLFFIRLIFLFIKNTQKRISSKIRAFCLVLSNQKAFFYPIMCFWSFFFLFFSRTLAVNSVSDFFFLSHFFCSGLLMKGVLCFFPFLTDNWTLFLLNIYLPFYCFKPNACRIGTLSCLPALHLYVPFLNRHKRSEWNGLHFVEYKSLKMLKPWWFFKVLKGNIYLLWIWSNQLSVLHQSGWGVGWGQQGPEPLVIRGHTC